MKTDIGLLWLRLTSGGIMLFSHGWGKLVNFTARMDSFPDPLGLGSPKVSLALAVFAEVFCAFALMAGVLTRIVVLPLIITMLVAVLIIHGDDPWSKKEFALLFVVPYVTLFFTGAGNFSVDRFIFKKEHR